MIVNNLNIAGLGITFSMIFKEPATINYPFVEHCRPGHHVQYDIQGAGYN